jgi:hypothetical protein
MKVEGARPAVHDARIGWVARIALLIGTEKNGLTRRTRGPEDQRKTCSSLVLWSSG